MEAVFLLSILVYVQIIAASCLPITVPAFVWSPQHHGSSGYDEQGLVNYHVISPRDLARSVLNTAGWSRLLCSGEKADPSVDAALIFIGNKLHSPDISRRSFADSDLIELLKASFTESNFSMAFPYVALSEDRETLANSLLSGFMENCEHGFRISEIAFMEPCSVEGSSFKMLADLNAVNDYMNARKESRNKAETDLIFMCSDKSSVLEVSGRAELEGKVLADILMNLKQSGITYTILYTSDPYEMIPYPRFEKLERQLISNASGNGSVNSTYCDGVCKTKASLLEGLLIGLVLLIILLSGLCCMMGIETPTRFEAPHES
eukprot:Gb_19135 [translate_table: standard]